MAQDQRRTAAMKPAWFHILLALGDDPQHGYAIRKLVLERTDGAVKLYPATLYGSIRDMTAKGLITALDGDDDPDDDQRRRYYRLTDLGRDALRGEVSRLEGLLDHARSTRALGGA